MAGLLDELQPRGGLLDDTGYKRGLLAPARRDVRTDELEWALPGLLAAPLQAWIRAMDAVRAGQIPSSADAREVALAMPMTGLFGAPARGAALASKAPMLYNPPVKSPRPFAADYPTGALADDTGRLLADIEGRPLVAETVVGRRMVGGADEAFPPAQLEPLTEALLGARPTPIAAREIRGDAGRFQRLVNPDTGALEYNIFLRRDLTPNQAVKVHGHELGHAIDELSGRIPTTGLIAELRGVYSTLATGQERARHLTGPQHLGYRAEETPRELMAEAIRAYMADPNYLKAVAPKTASAIRAAVNENPRLAPHVQFNIGAPPLGLLDRAAEPEGLR